MDKIKRKELLSETEIKNIYERPDFNASEQKIYFSLTDKEKEILNKYYTRKVKVFFILNLGYFKAKQQFFNYSIYEIIADIKYISNLYFSEENLNISDCLSPTLMRQQKSDILRLFNYTKWSIDQELHFTKHACESIRYQPKAKYVLRQLLNEFSNKQIVLPKYRKLQDILTASFVAEHERLKDIIASLPDKIKNALQLIIDNVDGMTKLLQIRADQKDFQYTAVKSEIEKARDISDLYEYSKIFLPKLQVSKNAITYYSELTEQYAGFRLRQSNTFMKYLQTICFINQKYRQIMDNLITSFIYHANAIIQASKNHIELAKLEHFSNMVVDFPKLAKFLDWFPKRDSTLNHSETNMAAYKILPKEQFAVLSKFLEGNEFDKKKAKWEFYSNSSRILSLYLRPIILTIKLEHYKNNYKLMDLVDIIKKHYTDGKSPSSFKLSDSLGLTIPKNMTEYLKNKDKSDRIDPYLFEFYVYEKIHHHLIRGTVFCNDSISYCDIEYDLIEDSLVDKVEEISHKLGHNKIPIYCDSRLDDAIQKLDEAWDSTTTKIGLNLNAGFNVTENKDGEKDWNLLYDSSKSSDDSFFKALPKVAIADMMMYIGNISKMWPNFSHLIDRNTKRKKSMETNINACILAEAFGLGIYKMGEISDINFSQLQLTRNNYIRENTLCSANDAVNNYTNSLPIFKLWDLIEQKTLGDADGQKILSTENTIQSRFSTKFFGKGKGISVYTLLANFVAVNARNIGSNEYEGHYLYDIISGNKTNIDIDMITGDNHSMNQLNFVALDSINIEYVPSIKSIRTTADKLYSVKSPEHYSGFLIPSGIINKERITSQKRGILRVLLSLALQENTQTNIIRKLNSHSRYARLKAGLFEYNKIFKSIHVLNLIDSMPLRKALRTARNRTESYHQLQGLMRKIYNGIFKGKLIKNNIISAHATRLVINCIVAYNSMILNKIYINLLKAGVSEKTIREFAKISPIAWIHIIFTGRYTFMKNNSEINIQEIVRILEERMGKTIGKLGNLQE